jgi:16S rRNA (cytosine967-C5)-methyltransferase
MRPRISQRTESMAARSASEPPKGAQVRAQAARICALVVATRVPAEAALTNVGTARDASLLRALVYAVLRWHHRLEWQLERLLTRPLARSDVELAALLRIGLVQLQQLRIPEHAAVSATVDACKLLGFTHAQGLVNAVLRRFLRERATLLAQGALVEEAHYSHPQWLIDALRADWGGATERILAANNELPPMWLRVNRRVTDTARYLQTLREQGIEARADERARSGILLGAPMPTSSIPGYADGTVSIQDGAAQLAAEMLDLQPGQRVLDACAAPGGKTAHILETCPDLHSVVALDRDAERLERVRENLQRLKLSATLVAADALARDDWWDGHAFERILLDAPCSSLGVIRRHPDIKVHRDESDVTQACELQARLLDSLWPTLAPGGRLVYATCTLLKRENAEQIERFRARAADAVPLGPSPPAGLQIFPGEANMDGFYYACLGKQPVP